MKKNLKTVNRLIMTLSLMLSVNTGARMERGNYSGVSSAAPGLSQSSGADTVNVTPTDSTGERCEPIPESESDFISQELLRMLLPDGEIRLSGTRSKPTVTIPRHIGVCTRLSIHTAPMGNDFVVMVRNGFDFTTENTGLTAEQMATKTVEELQEACIGEAGYLDDNKRINYDKIIADGKLNHALESEPGRLDLSRTNRVDSVNLFFASPKASEYGVAFPATSPTARLRMPCLAYENVGTTTSTRLRTSEKDKRMDEAIKVCESKNPQEIIDEIARNYNDGYEDIAKILERVLEDVKAPRIKEIYERMDEIELALRDDGDETASMEQAAELIGEYARLSTELERIQITPALNKMRTLMAERRRGVSAQRREEIERQMNALREDVKEFSTRSPSKSNLRFVYENAQRYALVDEIEVIEGLRLSSNYYSKLGSGTRNLSSIRAADERIERRKDDFTSVTRAWEDEYSLRSGNDFLLKSLDRKIKSRLSGLNRDIEALDRENKEMEQRYCAPTMLSFNGVPMPKNQYRCNKWREDYPQIRESLRKQAEEELAYIESLGEKYVEYEKIYEEGANTRRNNEVAFDDDFEVFGEEERESERRSVARDDAETRERRRYNFGEDDRTQSRDPLTQQIANIPMYPSLQQTQGQQQPFPSYTNRYPSYQQPIGTPFNPAATSYMNNNYQFNNTYNPSMLQFSTQGPSQMYNGYTGVQGYQGVPQGQGQIFGPSSFQPMIQPGFQQGFQQQGAGVNYNRSPAYMPF